MQRIYFWIVPVLLLVLPWLSASVSGYAAEASGKPAKPNIIVLFTDDLGYADTGFNGSRDIPTPNLDALAKQGVRFTDGYVTCPVCSPSRAGLLTGKYQQRFGFEFNGGGLGKNAAKTEMPASETLFPSYLGKAGYKTGMIGKWHLGGDQHPLDRGFDEFFGFLGGGHTYLPGEKDAKNPIVRNREPAPESEYLTTAFGREAVAFVDRHKAQPFFLYVAFNAPHVPLEATPELLDRVSGIDNKGRQTYAAMMVAVDDAVGRLVEKLRAEKLDQNTLIFFLSDNGAHLFAGGSNKPLREGKGTTWEGGIRIPFCVTWPGTIPPGEYSQPVISLDIAATALAAAGAKSPSDADGVDLLPFLTGKSGKAPHEFLFWKFGDFIAARKGKWKYTSSPKTEPALFDLSSDTSESNDVSKENPEVMQELSAAWKQWADSLPEPAWGPGIFEPEVLRSQVERRKKAAAK